MAPALEHPTQNPGFAAVPDAFASIARDRLFDDDEGIDFEDTYDGLGDALDEDDDLNNDTFGAAAGPPSKDFDFGQPPPTAGHLPAQPEDKMSKNYRSGYEAYKKPGYFSDLQLDQTLWAPPEAPRPAPPAPRRNMMSLEEVEAMMRPRSPPKTNPNANLRDVIFGPGSVEQREPARMPHPRQDMRPPSPTRPGQIISPDKHAYPRIAMSERQQLVEEEARRAKRSYKIHELSKGNGLMTPQDKNFITRIQLQQLVTATEPSPDASRGGLDEDFYYQVYRQIKSRTQAPSNFAQAYLNRIESRQRRIPVSHAQRMQQQVQRAVEAAKAKPKNKHLVIAGSLGKIQFSNTKTPKPLLNIKPSESPMKGAKTDTKATLRNIEAVYGSLIQVEDHDRSVPSEPHDPVILEEWRRRSQQLRLRLWTDLRVLDPIIPNSPVAHPFIAFLAHAKGKKAIPRIFSHIDHEQRLTVLTIIMIQLDTLDVVKQNDQSDLFIQFIMPCLFAVVTEATLNVLIGIVDLILDRTSIAMVVRSRVGLEILTMLLSQSEIMQKSRPEDQKEWAHTYDTLFNTIEPNLASVFASASDDARHDFHIWQFLATMGTGANPEQQQRLVLAVKDRVMSTVRQAKTMPAEIAMQTRGNVNLFMQAIGLDVNLLDD